MSYFEIDLAAKRARDEAAKEAESEQNAKLAARAAARKPLIEEMRKESNLSDSEFNRVLKKFGEETCLNNDYAHAALLGIPYKTKTGSNLW